MTPPFDTTDKKESFHALRIRQCTNWEDGQVTRFGAKLTPKEDL